jgi:hypothetical protein
MSASLRLHNDEYLRVLSKISKDSQMHRTVLESLINRLDGIDLFWLRDKVGHTAADYDFKSLSDEEIMKRITEDEHKAVEYYQKVFDESDSDFIKEIWKGDDYTTFFNKIDFLVGEEKKHVGWLESTQVKQEKISQIP